MRNISKTTVVITTVLFLMLTFWCFCVGFMEDPRTFTTRPYVFLAYKLFYVLRFPTHTLFPSVVYAVPGGYFIGFLINSLLYGLLVERLIALYQYKKVQKTDAELEHSQTPEQSTQDVTK